MRPPVPDSKIIFVRFQKTLDDIIEEYAKNTSTPKATVVRRAMTDYIRNLDASCQGRFDLLDKSDLAFSSLSSSFFVKPGRAIERSLGKPMRVTLKKFDEGNMRLAAASSGYSLPQFRTAIMVTWALKENLL